MKKHFLLSITLIHGFALNATASWQEAAQKNGVLLEKPSSYDPLTYKKNIAFFRDTRMPSSMKSVPKAPREMTEEEGQKLYFQGLLPLVKNANIPSPSKSEFGKAIKEGLVVDPPCATTNSQVLEKAFLKADLDSFSKLFSSPYWYFPTHNNEVQLKLLGWNYFLKKEYIAPPGAVGLWSRYTFAGTPEHSGHIFIIFKDGGSSGVDLVGDNTRKSSELHGHPYRMPGKTVGFWLPKGVYPQKRTPATQNKLP